MKQLAFISFLFVFIASCNSHSTAIPGKVTPDEKAETAAMMQVIENETTHFYNGKYDPWAAQWSHDPAAMQVWNFEDGSFKEAMGWGSINRQGKEWIETYYKNGENIIHPFVKRENLAVRFFSDSIAYLTWKQYNADKEKSHFTVSREIRLMKKEEGTWKILTVAAFWNAKQKIPVDSIQ